MNTVLQHTEDTPQGAVPPYYATILSDGTYVLPVIVPVPGYYSDAIYLQRYAADGTPIGDPVNIQAYVQENGIRVQALASGYVVIDTKAVAGFGSTYYYADYMQVFTADGVAVGSQVKVTQYGAAGISDVDQLDSGNLLFSFAYGTIGQAIVYDPAGNILHSETYRTVTSPIATTVEGGGFVEAWRGIDGKNHAQFFAATGLPVAPAFIVGGAANALAERAGGGFVMSWSESILVDGNYDMRVMVQAYDLAGHALGLAVDAGHVGNQGSIKTLIAALSDGNFVVVWESDATGDGDGTGIFACRFDSDGHALGTAFRVNISIAGDQSLRDVVATADGGFIVGWFGQGDAGPGPYHSAFSATADMSGNNLLYGTSGNDALNGRAGADIMAGGIGDDTYYVDNAGDQVQENANAGNDVTVSTITYQLTANVENLILRGEGAIDGLGNELNNRIFGNDAGNHLYGGAGVDDLRGMGGNDFLNGNSGADLMLGGIGDDTYSVETIGDRAIEYAGEGTDTVRASVAFTLGANVENLTLVGSGDLIGRGSDLANVLTGNAGANVLVGLGGNDRISGGAGADRMYGGLGDDTFYVDDINDKVLEASGEGNDRVYSSVTFWVYNQSIETVILTGVANIDGNGNSLNNSLFGNAGANHLNGASGDDKLDGGLGDDSLTGGGGSDIFFFSLNTGQDVISDFRAPGNDRINLHAYTGMEVTISQSGADTLIDLGGGNMVTVLNASQADVSSHIIW